MEDLKTYIESGILELYVLGDLEAAERKGVEKMAMEHPEIKAEIDAIEQALEAYAKANAIEPPKDLRSRTISSLTGISDIDADPVVPVVPLTVRGNNFYRYAFAASVALLLICGAVIYNLSSQLDDSNQQLLVLQSANQQFSNRVNLMESELDQTRQTLTVYQNPQSFKMVNLKGSPKAPEASLTVAFNAGSSEVMIDMSSLKMPSNDETHQYQLWALVDGKPVDLGVFDSTADSTGMKLMKSVKGAQAFAVTLEPRGGSVNPTLTEMMAIGNI